MEPAYPMPNCFSFTQKQQSQEFKHVPYAFTEGFSA